MSREQGGSGSGSFYPWRAGTGAPPPQGQGSWRRGQASGSGVPQQGSSSSINQGQGHASGPQRYNRHSSGYQSYQHALQQAGHHQRRYEVDNQRYRLQSQAATGNHPRSAGDAGHSYQAQPAAHPGPSWDGNYDFSRQVHPAPNNYMPRQQAWQLLQQFPRLVIEQFMQTQVVAPYMAGVSTPQETASSSSQGQQILNMQCPLSNPLLPANSGIPVSGTSFTQRPTPLSGTAAPDTSDGPAGPERPKIYKERYAANYPSKAVRDSNTTRRSLSQMPKPPALDENIAVYDIDDDSDDAADSASMSPASAKANEDSHESGSVPKSEEEITLVTVLNQIVADETLISADFLYNPKVDPAKIREAESKIFLPQFNDGCTIAVADSRCDIFMPDELAHHQQQAEECSNEKSVTEAAATVTEANYNRDSVVQEDRVHLVSYADSDCEDLPPSHTTTLGETTSSGNMQQAGIGNFVQLEQGGGETDFEKDNVEDENSEATVIYKESVEGDSQSTEYSACTTNNDGDVSLTDFDVENSWNPDLDDSSNIFDSKQDESRFVRACSSLQYESAVAHEAVDFEESSSVENMFEDLGSATINSLTDETEDYQVSGFTTFLLEESESAPEWNETVASTTEDHVSNVQSATEVRYEDINTGELVEKQNPVIYNAASEENVADPVPGCSKAISAFVGVQDQVEDVSYTEELNEDTILQTDRASNSDTSVTNFEPVDDVASEQTVRRFPPFVETGLEQGRAKGLVSAAFIGLYRKRNYQVPILSRLMTLKKGLARRATTHPRQDQRSVLVPFVRSLAVTSREEVRKAKICFIGPGYLRSFLAGVFNAFFNQGPENIYLRDSETLKEFLDHNDKVEDDRFQVGKFVYMIDCDKPIEMDQTLSDLTLLTRRIKFTAQLVVVSCRSKRNTSWKNIQSISKDLCQIRRQFSVDTRNLFKDDPVYVKAFIKTLKKSLEMNVLGITQEILKSEFRRAIQPQPQL